tara:strand:+ start:10321 stop:10602 length:282 start_codon:yes stop_codon:yes gene_type:complete
MLSYLVIGTCIFLLIAVIYFSIKPISMGIEARRNINNSSEDEVQDDQNNQPTYDFNLDKESLISDEIIKLNKLKNEGLITQEEFEKAKKKLIT